MYIRDSYALYLRLINTVTVSRIWIVNLKKYKIYLLILLTFYYDKIVKINFYLKEKKNLSFMKINLSPLAQR